MVEQLEQALDGVRFGVERQLGAVEADTLQLERLFEDLQQYTRGCTVGVCANVGGRPAGPWEGHPGEPAEYRRESSSSRDGTPQREATDRPKTEPTPDMKSLLVCYFPREANKAMIRDAFAPFGTIDSVYLVHKQGKPACYGFVNFSDHLAAERAVAAADAEQIRLVDRRGVVWNVKAEWTTTPDIPKKPKKKKTKDDRGSRTPPLDFATLPGFPQQPFRSHHRFAQLSYQVPVRM